MNGIVLLGPISGAKEGGGWDGSREEMVQRSHIYSEILQNLLLISVLPSPPPRPADIGSELVSDTQIAGHGLRGTIPTFGLHCGDQFDHGGLVIINSNTAHSPVDGTGHKLYSLAGLTGFKVYIFKHDGEDEFLVRICSVELCIDVTS